MNPKKSLQLPFSYIQQNQYVTALEHYKRLLSHNPGFLADALIPLYHILQTRDEDWYLRLVIAELYVSTRYFSDALYELEDLYEQNPNFSQMYFLLGKIWVQSHNPRVLTLFESAIDHHIFNSVILDTLPQVYMSQNDMESSIRLFKKLILEFPQNTHYHQTLADLYIKAERYEDALPEYRALISKSPMHAADVIRRLSPLISQVPDPEPIHLFLVHLYSMLYDPESGLPHLEALWPISEKNLLPEYERLSGLFPNNARLLLASGSYLLRMERFSEGIDYLSQLYALSPNDYKDIIHEKLEDVLQVYPLQVYAHQLLSQIALDQHAYSESLSHIQVLSTLPLDDVSKLIEELGEIIIKAPQLEAQSRLLMAHIYMNNGNYIDAMSQCEAVVSTPLVAAAKQQMGLIYARQNQHDHALTMLREYHHLSAELSPSFMASAIDIQTHRYQQRIQSDTPIAIGLMHTEMGHLHESIVLLQKIPTADTDSELATLTLCHAYLEQGKFEFALRHLNTLETLSASQPERHMNVHFLQAVAHTLLGESEKAIDALESIVNLDIGFPYAPPLLTHLRKAPATHYRGRMLTWLLTLSGPVLIAVPNENPVDPMHLSLAMPHQEKGITYAMKQQYTAGIEALDLAHQLAPENPNAQLNTAYIHAIEGHVDAAKAILPSTALQELTSTSRRHLEAGLLDMAGDVEGALSLLSSNTRPTALCQINMGFLHWKQHHYDTAISLWENALNEVPAFPFVARCISPVHNILPNLKWLPPIFQFPKTW